MRKKILTILLTAALAAGAIAGCSTPATPSSGSSSAAGSGAASSGDSKTLAVAFPTGNIRIAINILAQQLGYFKEEGVTVQEVNLQGPDALTAINGDGNLDILTVGFVPDLQAIGSGYDLKVIAGTAVEGGAIIAKKGNADKYKDASKKINIEEIKKATKGLQRNEAAWVITRQYLLDNGVSADDLKKIEDESTGSLKYYQDQTAVAQAVQKGEVEVAFLPHEYALLYADSYGLEVIAKAGDLQPNYVCCREVTSTKRLSEKKDAFTAYEIARLRAFEYYKKGETDKETRDKVVEIVTKWSGKEASYVDTYLYGGVTKYDTDPNTSGIVKYVQAAYNSGLLSKAGVDFSKYDIKQNIDTDSYKTALETLVKRDSSNQFFAGLLDQYKKDNA